MIIVVLLIVLALVVVTVPPAARPVANAGVKTDTSLRNTVPRGVGIIGTGEVNLFHLPLGVLVPKVPVVLDHPALRMAEPLADLSF